MNKRKVKVIIRWISKDNGGRQNLPMAGSRYCPIIRINNDNELESSWSADIKIEKYSDELVSYADLQYLSDKGPHELLKKENTFELFEGDRKVAIGTIIED